MLQFNSVPGSGNVVYASFHAFVSIGFCFCCFRLQRCLAFTQRASTISVGLQ